MLKIQEDGNLILLAVKIRSRKLPQKTEAKKAEITSEEQGGTEVGNIHTSLVFDTPMPFTCLVRDWFTETQCWGEKPSDRTLVGSGFL